MFKRLIYIIDYLPLFFIAVITVVFPLIFSINGPAANVFELFKSLYFYLFLFVLALFSLIKYLVVGHDKNLISQLSDDKKILLVISIFLVITFLLMLTFSSLVLSFDYIQAIFGSYARQQGLLIYFSYFAFFILTTYQLVITGRQLSYQARFKINSKILLLAASLSGLLVSLYGFWQYFGLDSYQWQEPVMADRVISSLGQPNLLASFLLLSIGASLASYFFSRNFYWRLFFIINIISQILIVYLSASRAAWLAISLAFVVFIFLTIKKKFKKYFLGLLVGLFIISLLLIKSPILSENRLTSSFDISQGSTAARLYFYQASWEAISSRPLFGHGLEQGSNIFVKFYQPDWALFVQVNDYPDRAHNLLLDILLNFGFLGLLFHVTLWLLVIIVFFEMTRDKDFYWRALSLWLFLVAYLISLAFGFSSLASNLYLMVFLSIFFAHFLSSGRKINNRLQLLLINLQQKVLSSSRNVVFSVHSDLTKKLIILLLIIIMTGLSVNAWPFLRANIRADRLFFACQRQTQPRVEDNLWFCFQSLEQVKSPIQKKHYQNFTVRYLLDHQQLIDPAFKEISFNYLRKIYPELNEKDYNSLLVKAKIACILPEVESSQYYEKLISLSPARPLVYQERASCYLSQANYLSAINDYRQALSLLPDVNNDRISQRHQDKLQFYYYLLLFGLGQAQAGNQNYSEAVVSYQLAYSYHPQNFYLLERLAQVHYLAGDLLLAIDYYQRLWEKDSNNYRWPQAIFHLYQELNQEKEAKKYQAIVDDLLNN